MASKRNCSHIRNPGFAHLPAICKMCFQLLVLARDAKMRASHAVVLLHVWNTIKACKLDGSLIATDPKRIGSFPICPEHGDAFASPSREHAVVKNGRLERIIPSIVPRIFLCMYTHHHLSTDAFPRQIVHRVIVTMIGICVAFLPRKQTLHIYVIPHYSNEQ